MSVVLESPLVWRDVVAVAEGTAMELSPAARQRLAAGRALVEAIVDRGLKVYGVSTGVGAFCDVVVPREQQRALSRNIVFSHAAGLGPALDATLTRAIMAAAINNYAHGASGVRPALVDLLLACLNRRCTPDVPSQGSVGYISHMAHIGLVLMGEGSATVAGQHRPGREALAQVDQHPLVLDTKEGLCIVNGTPCGTGLACLALARAERFLDWADAVAALSFECLGGQLAAYSSEAMAFRASPGQRDVAARLRAMLDGSERVAAAEGSHLQDALSLRAVPHVHGAARDAFAYAAHAIDQELASVSDNPVVFGTPDDPKACSAAHAVGAAVALAMDTLAIAVAEVAAMAERRLDRLVNPLVSGLPAFLAVDGGLRSGFMIAQYSAASLVGENRRLASPASLDGGVTSGLQEDHLVHATPAALKTLTILENATRILAIELTAGTQASELALSTRKRGDGTDRLVCRVRDLIPPYKDDRPIAEDLARIAELIRTEAP